MAMETNSGLKTQSFMLSADDIKIIDAAKKEADYTTKSEALRHLIHDAVCYRNLKRGVEEKVLKKVQSEIAIGLLQALSKEQKPID